MGDLVRRLSGLSLKHFTSSERRREQSLREYAVILENLKKQFERRCNAVKTNPKASTSCSRGEFQFLKTLGTGSFGRVILVRRQSDQSHHAIKILQKRHIVKYKQLEHTYSEKSVLQCIDFPFLVNLECYFKDNSYIYYVLPYVGGGEMFTQIRRAHKFDESISRFYAAQVLLALEYLHACNVIYRDLKPENILLDAQGYLKITDFGFSKVIDARTWTFCGTPEYMAPEIILSKGYGKAVDWWSFGVLIYEMMAGFPPFFSKETIRVYEKIALGKFKFPAHFRDDARDLIQNLLQVDLSRRFGNLKAGCLDIKKHRWFNKIEWLKIFHKKVEPAFVPVLANEVDTIYFDDYAESELKVAERNEFPEEFKNF